MLEIAKVITKRFICVALNASLCVGTLGLAACNNQSPQNAPAPSSTTAPSASAPAPAGTASNAPSAYTPPSADQLYQLVAPIALFPDKLVAQVLAGSTYPDQVTAADDLLAKNSNLKGALLQTAIDPQPWDPSVKGLTAFPSVLDQMAKNIQWTTSLGTAYVNDPTDVMNAIQVMRQRASKNGSLVSNSKQRLVTAPVTATTTVTTQTETDYPPTYSGPEVVPAPQETIQIEPAESDVVYVPSYNPETVYGDAVPYYPGYAYSPGYSTGDVVVAGAIGFGAGILIANLFDHHDNRSWGWNSWGMRWGGGGGYRGGGYNGGGYNGGGWVRPAVVHNDNVYVSRSNTVINRYTTNNVTNNNRYVNNSVNNSNNNNNNNRENFNRTVQNNNPNSPNNPNNENRRFDPRENLANRAAASEGPRAPNTLRPGPVSQAVQPRAEARGPMTTPNFQNAMQHDQRIQAMRGGATPAQAAAAGQPRGAAAEAARTSQRMQPFDARQQEANEARTRQESRIENTPRENPGAQRLPVAPSFHPAAPEAARQQQPRQDMQQEQQQRAAMQQRQQVMERQAQQPRPEPQQQRMQQEQRQMPQQQQRVQQQPRQEQHAAPEHRAAPAEHGDKKDDNHHR